MDGREPVEVTEHEYDGERLVRSVTTREPMFTERDRVELLALGIYRDGLCPLCGRPREICGAPEGTHQFEPVWEVCQATRTVAEKQSAVYTPDNHPDRASHLWGSTTIRRR